MRVSVQLHTFHEVRRLKICLLLAATKYQPFIIFAAISRTNTITALSLMKKQTCIISREGHVYSCVILADTLAAR